VPARASGAAEKKNRLLPCLGMAMSPYLWQAKVPLPQETIVSRPS